jgi:hypothetical protein
MTRRILLAILAAVTAAAAALAPAGPAAAGDSITPTTPIPRLPYSFTNFLSGTCLGLVNLNGAFYLTGVEMQCPGMLWYPIYDSATNTYKLIDEFGERCLEAGILTVNADRCDGTAFQQWRFTHPGFSDTTRLGRLLNSTRLVENVGNGECMTVYRQGGGGLIVPEPCDRDQALLWFINPVA